jgi:ribosome biogenesis GTPase
VLGSSGVGKSTLINALTGDERLETRPTRADEVGRHTTTHRELVVIPTGGLVIDTPGLREILMWDGDTDAVFTDVAELASACRFRDCTHRREPGCAVRAAMATGELDAARLRAYEKMQRELAYVEGRKHGRAKIDRRTRNKGIAKANRQRMKLNPDRYP